MSHVSIHERAADSMVRHLKKIKQSDDFNRTIKDAFLDRRDWENAPDKDVVNVVWGPEEYLNATDIDRSLGGVHKKAQVFWHFLLDCSDIGPFRARAQMQADIEQYFLKDENHRLPEPDGTDLIFNLFQLQTPLLEITNLPRRVSWRWRFLCGTRL